MSEHYFTASPAAEAEERVHRSTIRGVEHAVATASGVFSADRLDKGAQALFDHAPDPPKIGISPGLGCDWGLITLALAGVAPGATVLAADVNEHPLALTTRNAAAAGLDNVRTSQAEALLAELCQTSTPVDFIWSNPSVCIGKDALYELLLSWLALLSADGEAWLVVLKSLGVDSLTTWLNNQDWDVNQTASSKGFRVPRVCRRHDRHVAGPCPDGVHPTTGVVVPPGAGR